MLLGREEENETHQRPCRHYTYLEPPIEVIAGHRTPLFEFRECMGIGFICQEGEFLMQGNVKVIRNERSHDHEKYISSLKNKKID